MKRNQLTPLLKGQCHEIFYHFAGLKDLTWAPYEQAKNCFANFFVFAKIFNRKVRKSLVHVVNDYADTLIFLYIGMFSYF